jgi:TRAP-type C4-dicarboxylate transport system substrate-binding protein
MKKWSALLLSLVLLLSVSACGAKTSTETPADDTVYEFKLDYPAASTSVVGQFLTGWVEDVKEASNGRINITLYHSSSLGPLPDIIDNLINGVSDICWDTPSMFSGLFPVTEGTNLPLLGITTPKVGADLLFELYTNTDLMTKEYESVHPLALYTACEYYFATGKNAPHVINTVDDIKGLKFRSQGIYASKLVELLGGTPISMHPSEMYESLSKNVIDAHLSDLTVYKSWNLAEVTGHVVESSIYRFSAFMLMNKEAYASLPDDLKAVMDENSGINLAYGLGDAFEAGAQEGIELYKAAGATTSAFSDADMKVIEAAGEQVQEIWVSDMNGNGYDGQAILDTYKSILADLKK